MSSSKRIAKFKNSSVLLFISIALVVVVITALQMSRMSKPETVAIAPSQAPVATPSIDGIYKGNLPCADCAGITETLILAKDGSYILEDLYQGKSVKPFQVQGKWEKTNDVLKLTQVDDSEVSYFEFTSDGNLQMLDENMQKIATPFNQTLTKEN